MNKLVLVSRSGFYNTAKRKAAALGVEALTPTQPVSDDGPLAALKVEVESRYIKWLRVSEGVAWVEGHEKPFAVTDKTAMFTEQGVEAITVGNYTAQAINGMDQGEPLKAARHGDNKVKLEFEDLWMHDHRSDSGLRPYLQFADDTTLHRIERLQVVWDVEVTIEAVPLQHGLLGETPYAFGKGPFMGEESLIVVTRTGEEHQRLNVQVSSEHAAHDLEGKNFVEQYRPPPQ